MEPKRSRPCGNFLPEETIMFHILPKLPVKSVLRFKCVSKPWYSFLSTQMFKEMHLNHVTNDNHQNNLKLIFLSITIPKTFCTLDSEHGLTTSRCLPFNADFEGTKILSSFHGLVCVGLNNGRSWYYSDIIFWNPSMSEYKTLSKANSHKDCYYIERKTCDLYYSSFDDDYKLLCVTCNYKTYIYSLKSDSWKSIGFLKGVPHVSQAWIRITWLNEKLYFLKLVTGDKYRDCYSIIRFDPKTEEFTEIATPSFRNQDINVLTFTVIRGSINLCIVYTDLKVNSEELRREIELWRMVGDGQWTKVVNYWWKPYLTLFPRPLHVMRNGNWLMHYEYIGKCHIYKTDMEKNLNVISCSYNPKTMSISLGREYIETFMSPNRYIK